MTRPQEGACPLTAPLPRAPRASVSSRQPLAAEEHSASGERASAGELWHSPSHPGGVANSPAPRAAPGAWVTALRAPLAPPPTRSRGAPFPWVMSRGSIRVWGWRGRPGSPSPSWLRAAVGMTGGGGLRLGALSPPPPSASLFYDHCERAVPAATPQPPGAPSAASLCCSIRKATRSNFAETRPLRRPGPRVRPQPSGSAQRRTQDRRSLVRPAGCRSAGSGRRAGGRRLLLLPVRLSTLAPALSAPSPLVIPLSLFPPSLQLLGELSLFLHKRHFLLC